VRLQGLLPLLAAVLVVLVVSACGSSSSNPTANGAPVDSSAMRSKLEQELVGTADVKAPQAKKIVDCIIAKMSAAGIKTNGEAASHEDEVDQFSTACAEKVVGAGG
jgi:uncharacterized lipoprotein